MANFHKVKGKKVCNKGYVKVKRGHRKVCVRQSRRR